MLTVENLVTEYGPVRAVDDVSLSVEPGRSTFTQTLASPSSLASVRVRPITAAFEAT